MNKQLKLVREMIAKPRPMVLTWKGLVDAEYVIKIRNQLRKEILEEFDKTFKDDK